LPISIATALAINEYAPRSIRRWLTSLVDRLRSLGTLRPRSSSAPDDEVDR
jgi:ABC-type phosphate transport system permease subunit